MRSKDFEANIDEEGNVADGLRALAAADRERQAPPQQEVLLLREFRRHSQAPAPQHAVRSWRFALGFAAAILILVAVGARLLHRTVPPPPPKMAAVPEAPVAKAPEQPPEPPPQERMLRELPPMRRRAAARASTPRREIATEFIPLAYGDGLTPLEGGQLVRIRLSRSALRSFGLPANEERAGERVQADVLLGQDGVARAIRFVH